VSVQQHSCPRAAKREQHAVRRAPAGPAKESHDEREPQRRTEDAQSVIHTATQSSRECLLGLQAFSMAHLRTSVAHSAEVPRGARVTRLFRSISLADRNCPRDHQSCLQFLSLRCAPYGTQSLPEDHPTYIHVHCDCVRGARCGVVAAVTARTSPAAGALPQLLRPTLPSLPLASSPAVALSLDTTTMGSGRHAQNLVTDCKLCTTYEEVG
jgi:hypothetical protein